MVILQNFSEIKKLLNIYADDISADIINTADLAQHFVISVVAHNIIQLCKGSMPSSARCHLAKHFNENVESIIFLLCFDYLIKARHSKILQYCEYSCFAESSNITTAFSFDCYSQFSVTMYSIFTQSVCLIFTGFRDT